MNGFTFYYDGFLGSWIIERSGMIYGRHGNQLDAINHLRALVNG